MFEIRITDNLLLTGAGFTKNFGGYLASEMWAKIFNSSYVGGSETLLRIAREDTNYERLYSKVLEDPESSPDDKERIKQAVRFAYSSLDKATHTRGLPGHPYIPNVMKLVNVFGGNSSRKGLVFTLNQDVWLERQTGPNCPGVPSFTCDLTTMHSQELDPKRFITINHDGAAERARRDVNERGGLIYLKLHGSYGWKAEASPDQMIIGTTKAKMIAEHPLFTWYLKVFKWAIARGGQRLLIMGYGFRDDHINQVLVEGVEKHGLQLYILSTTHLDALKQEMAFGQAWARPLLDGIRGYYPYSLSEVFPSDQRQTEHAEQIFAHLS